MLNVVLIGVGAVSKSHISAWLKQENARVIGVADFLQIELKQQLRCLVQRNGVMIIEI